jgi:hypothetical protein
MQHNDFGVVSLSKNPYAKNDEANEAYYCILVAGIHGPATYQGINLLAHGDFSKHPLGGVFEVMLDPYGAWRTRLKRARRYWHTRDYTIAEVLENLRTVVPSSLSRYLSPDEIADLISFVQRFSV